MNRRLSILLLFVFFTSLQASVLLDFYHRDYQMADRSVLVFDKQPNYKITKNDSHLLITIQNCQLDYDVIPQTFDENKLIKSINYNSQKDKLVIDFDLHKNKGKLPIWETMEFSQKVQQYKVVIDFIKTKSPQTNLDAIALAGFYETTGRSDTAKDILDQITVTPKIEPKLKTESKPEQVAVKVDTLIETPKQANVETTKETSFTSYIINLFKIFPLLFYVIFILAIVLVILSIRIISRNKRSFPKTSKATQYSFVGFCSKDLQKKTALKLSASGWSDENIAKELYMNIGQLNELLQDDISNQEIEEQEDR